ncbi:MULTISPECIES: DUF3450 domain-containing protein [unclassified Modicisalibacter]|uniref:DUF3450 domain-containing protein n=1 Tax=unclassified Modicisalibacter TaxID=2679913 RepID=UPI001CCE5779|nr:MULTISPECIES: DUF3450 domain-containing protein [unclassified Modicisalibacter]MBZ9556573.1 DUF3450 domain-containing protein [Modicisalibacter sp. R2A 31.J]MBZ9574958.1 DUF3450 domain-containing protein [Modicisalibacter sp. MOD 31.J]
MKPHRAPRGTGVLTALLLAGVPLGSQAQDTLREQSVSAQQTQAQLQQKIDAADDETRQALRELRSTRREASRLEDYDAELARQVERQAKTLAQRERAVSQLADAEERLPVLTRQLVGRLQTLVDADMPFLRGERQARIESLQQMLDDGELSAADKLDRVLAAWRTELDYGREVDAWHGRLYQPEQGDAGASEASRAVDYLRVGRLGWYYLTPDGDRGGVWQADAHRWQPLDGGALREVRKGLRIARDERAPALLDLPVSLTPEDASPASAETSHQPAEGDS